MTNDERRNMESDLESLHDRLIHLEIEVTKLECHRDTLRSKYAEVLRKLIAAIPVEPNS